MKQLGVVAVMLTIELLDVVVYTVSKAAMKKGMNDFVLVMYSNAFSACFLLPITLIFYRKRALPSLTCCIVAQLFLNGLLSCSVQTLRFLGIGYSSPTLASAMSDLIPAFTFMLAIVCSVIGATIVIIGFYAVIWGKGQEKAEKEYEVYTSASYSPVVPLLQNKKMEE
ncbi:WAT1-related protein [Spatholobus suberectus]|nr:WAT1-related protein [Spatholobus suberectus]